MYPFVILSVYNFVFVSIDDISKSWFGDKELEVTTFREFFLVHDPLVKRQFKNISRYPGALEQIFSRYYMHSDFQIFSHQLLSYLHINSLNERIEWFKLLRPRTQRSCLQDSLTILKHFLQHFKAIWRTIILCGNIQRVGPSRYCVVFNLLHTSLCM